MAASGISCVMWSHFVVACVLSWSVVCGILVHWPGIKPTFPALQGEFLTTGPQGKSLRYNFKYNIDLPYCVSVRHMATHSSTLAWKIAWMEESGRLQSMGSQRVRYDWVTSLHTVWGAIQWYISYKAPYDRKWRTKEPLDESERGEWKSWLKAQHSENKDHGIQSHQFMAK